MAGGAHVGVDTSVGTVGTSAHFGGLVHLNMLNHQRVHIQTLGEKNQETALRLQPQQYQALWSLPYGGKKKKEKKKEELLSGDTNAAMQNNLGDN